MESPLSIIDTFGLSILLAFLVVFFAVCYSYCTCNYNCWKKQGIPGDKPWPFVGTWKPTQSVTRFEMLDQERHEKYGRIYGGFEGQIPVLYVTDPEIIKQVFVKDFPAFTNRRHFEVMQGDPLFGSMISVLRGEEWKATRAVLTPTFTSGKLKHMVYLVEDCIKTLADSLEKFAEDKIPVEMKLCFSCFSMDVIASCAFGTKTNSIENPNSKFMTEARKGFGAPAFLNYLIIVCPKIFIFLQKFINVRNPFQHFADVASEMIDMRIKNKLDSRKDFLDLLLEAEREENQADNLNDNSSRKKKILTRQSMISNSVVFLLGGYDTTANTLALFSYNLATNPEVQEKLIKEIDDALIECQGKLSYEVVMKLQYLDMALSESLRLYPPVVRVERACGVEGYKVGDIVFKKESVVVTSTYCLHRDKEFYPNPEVYDPERFSAEAKLQRNPFTYMPFGAGPRNCIAMRFALVEVKFAMANLLSQFRFSTCDKTEFPIKFRAGPNVLSPQSIMLMVEKRKDQLRFET